ncbi:hypothetical protein ACYSNX_00055 [Myroides sp. LJL115]
MRRTLFIFTLFYMSLFTQAKGYAQELAPDQNPNYRSSMYHYLAIADSITQTEGTTLQDTYKAYDWYEAKQEKKLLRKQWRHEQRMERAKYSRNYYNGYSGGYYGNYYNRWNNGWNWAPRIGFRTGNWWFST